MKYVKLFEQFIKEDAMKPNEESEVIVDDIELENGKIISSAEIVGVIINSESEAELEDYFYSKYGQNAFKAGELAEINKLWNEYTAEEKEKEAEEEKEAEGGEDDLGLGDIGGEESGEETGEETGEEDIDI